MVRRLVAVAVVLVVARAAGAADLERRLAAMARKHAGRVAFFARDLATGRTVAVAADVPVKTASVIKLALFLEAFRQIDGGKHRLDEPVVLDEQNRVLGSGVLGFLHAGLSLTLEDVLVLMMVASDNTATNLAIDVIGVDAVNENARRMGLASTHLYKKIGVPAAWPMPADQKQFGLGKTTAREAAAMMEAVERCELRDARLCRRMLEILVNQQYRNMLPRFLETTDITEATSAIGDKIGALDKVRNDVALVYGASGPIVIAGFTWDNRDERWSCESEPELLLARMAKLVVTTWSPGGLVTGGPPRLRAK